MSILCDGIKGGDAFDAHIVIYLVNAKYDLSRDLMTCPTVPLEE